MGLNNFWMNSCTLQLHELYFSMEVLTADTDVSFEEASKDLDDKSSVLTATKIGLNESPGSDC